MGPAQLHSCVKFWFFWFFWFFQWFFQYLFPVLKEIWRFFEKIPESLKISQNFQKLRHLRNITAYALCFGHISLENIQNWEKWVK